MMDQSSQWVARIRQGDREAFHAMFQAHYGGLCTFAADYVGSMDRARDVVQEVFLAIWERRASWTIHGSLRSYLYQSVRNRALNATRNRSTRHRAYRAHRYQRTAAAQRTAEDQAFYHQLATAVHRAIDQLPPRRRTAFLLHRRHDFTYAEIAQIMDITPKTVENQIGRALQFLRRRLTEDILSEP